MNNTEPIDETRTVTVREWIVSLIGEIRNYCGVSLVTGNTIIIEIPDYLDDSDPNNREE